MYNIFPDYDQNKIPFNMIKADARTMHCNFLKCQIKLFLFHYKMQSHSPRIVLKTRVISELSNNRNQFIFFNFIIISLIN